MSHETWARQWNINYLELQKKSIEILQKSIDNAPRKNITSTSIFISIIQIINFLKIKFSDKMLKLHLYSHCRDLSVAVEPTTVDLNNPAHHLKVWQRRYFPSQQEFLKAMCGELLSFGLSNMNPAAQLSCMPLITHRLWENTFRLTIDLRSITT